MSCAGDATSRLHPHGNAPITLEDNVLYLLGVSEIEPAVEHPPAVVDQAPGSSPWNPTSLDRLPGSPSDDPFTRLAAAFLMSYAESTAKAYFGDLKVWHAWCTTRGVDPLGVERHQIDAWVRHQRTTPQAKTGSPVSPATIARRLSCLSKFYDYAVRDVEVLDASPVARVRRPKVSEDSPTIGLAQEELDRLLDAAEADGLRSAALVTLLMSNGLRIDEALAADVEHFTYQEGHRVLRVVRKGAKAATVPLPPLTVRALDTYLGARRTGPLFLADNTHRLSYSTAYALIRRLAKRAVIPAAEHITPHSLRHSFATRLLATGVPLQDVQDAMGHADPRTTRRHDRSRHDLDRHPAYAMAALLRRSPVE